MKNETITGRRAMLHAALMAVCSTAIIMSAPAARAGCAPPPAAATASDPYANDPGGGDQTSYDDTGSSYHVGYEMLYFPPGTPQADIDAGLDVAFQNYYQNGVGATPGSCDNDPNCGMPEGY